MDGRAYLVLPLFETKGTWFVVDIDIESKAGVDKELARFLKKHPGAKKIPKK